MLLEEKVIRKIVASQTKKYSTNNPYELADCLKIKIFYAPLGSLSGFYKYMERHKCIFINSDIENDNFKRFVTAHELGHAIMHTKENCYFMDNKTLLQTSKFEIQANQFAAQLLIPDEIIFDNMNLTIEQFARLLGYEKSIIEIRMQLFQKNHIKKPS
jgi:Zn-dependent peptidase ImmA (M78 family)